MDQRKQQVLQAIIREYVGRVEPVSSKNITGKYGLEVSSATLRNEMQALEKMGYIEQPHTSAGRVPSELGYRYYVDFLMERYRLALREKEAIKHHLDERVHELDDLLRKAGDIISSLTHYPSIVSEPVLKRKCYKHLKMVSLSDRLALLVVVLDDGEIKNYQVNLVGPLQEEDIDLINRILNEGLVGKDVLKLDASSLDRQAFRRVQDKIVLEDILEALAAASRQDDVHNIHLSGTLNIFNQPEFNDLDKVKGLLEFFEHQKGLEKLIENSQEGIRIQIGEEVPFEDMEGLSVITSTYCVNGRQVGTIGVIGPTRMTYSKNATLLEKVSQGLGLSLIRLLE